LLTLASVHEMLEQLEKDVNNMVRVGAVNRNDLLQVQLRKGEVESTTLEVENSLATVSQLLAQYIGKSDETIDVSLPDGFVFGAVPDLPVTLRQNHQTALAATPQYRLLEKNVESKRIQRSMTIGQNLPSVGVGASYSYNNFLGSKSNAVLFATVSVPISDWWGGSHAIKRRKAELQRAEQQQVDNAELLKIRMQKAWNDAEEARQQLLLAERGIEQASENLRLNRNYYRAGTCRMSELLEAQLLYQQTLDKRTDAYADYRNRLLDYRQAAGQ
jgi:outer membrane protein TolC